MINKESRKLIDVEKENLMKKSHSFKNASKQTIMISTQRTQYLFVSLFRLFLNLTEIYKQIAEKKMFVQQYHQK